MLWFSGPPIDIDPVTPPSHSIKYLTYLAKKKLTEGGQDTKKVADGGDDSGATLEGESVPSRGGDNDVGPDQGGLWGREDELRELLLGN